MIFFTVISQAEWHAAQNIRPNLTQNVTTANFGQGTIRRNTDDYNRRY